MLKSKNGNAKVSGIPNFNAPNKLSYSTYCLGLSYPMFISMYHLLAFTNCLLLLYRYLVLGGNAQVVCFIKCCYS